MHDAIRSMVDKRAPKDEVEWNRALREVLQEAALAGLWRSKFFDKAAFYGGTALRLFHGLDRFSEDLDFTLLDPDPSWNLSDRLQSLRTEIEAFGFDVTIEPNHEGPVESAFIKANTRIHLLRIEAPSGPADRTAPNHLVRVKLETDTDPPDGIRTEVRPLLEPFPVSVRVVVPECMGAGKVHACIARSWKSRVKGRDWYDLIFFAARGLPVDLGHLEARLRQTGHWSGDVTLTETAARSLLARRIEELDWRKAVQDVLPFIRDTRAVEAWDKGLFLHVAERLIFR